MDIINEIIRDHRVLRELLDKIKAEDTKLRTKKAAFRELVPLVKAHAHAEEKALYVFARTRKALKAQTLEAYEEHAAATALAEKAARSHSPDLWLARATVFCDMLEHHLDEEEDEFFPDLRKLLSDRRSDTLAAHYRALMPPADFAFSERDPTRRIPFLRPVTSPLEAFIP